MTPDQTQAVKKILNLLEVAGELVVHKPSLTDYPDAVSIFVSKELRRFIERNIVPIFEKEYRLFRDLDGKLKASLREVEDRFSRALSCFKNETKEDAIFGLGHYEKALVALQEVMDQTVELNIVDSQ
jgi:hypothetical protein